MTEERLGTAQCGADGSCEFPLPETDGYSRVMVSYGVVFCSITTTSVMLISPVVSLGDRTLLATELGG